MAFAPFVPLRVLSAFSMLEGAIEPKAIAKLATERGFPAIAMCDRNGLYGSVPFAQACIENGVQPIVGALLGVARPDSDQIDHLPLYVQDDAGWLNLCRLVSAAHLERPLEQVPHVQLAALEGYTDGLIALTGAMIVALGHEHGGLFANDDALADSLAKAGQSVGEKLWRFPLSDAYDKLLDSPIADMKNIGPRYAGSITAAQFIKRFVDEGVKWAHLDIAGMVWSDKPGATWDKGATGYGVRLLDRFVTDRFER